MVRDRSLSRVAWLPVALIGAMMVALLVATIDRYGYHRDEMYFRVLAGRPAEALAYVPAEHQVPPHCFDEYAETLGRVYEALGRAEDLRELRKRHFLQRPDPERLQRYLGGLAAEARPAAKERMRQAVLSGGYDPTHKAAFFAELGEGATAAQVILADPTALGRAAYPALQPLARRLEPGPPVAASDVNAAVL